MRLGLTTEQRDFGVATAKLLAGQNGPERWARLAELGIPGLLVPEEHGGADGDDVDLLAPIEAAGYAAAPEPLIETAIATGLLRGSPLAGTWLPKVAGGECVVAVTEPGTSHAVAADRAALVLVERGGAWHAATDFTTAERPSLDEERRLFTVSAQATEPLPTADAATAFDRGAILTAAYLLGVARRMIDMSVEHASTRVQFGRPVGSYQAIKHQFADALVAVEFARPSVHQAAYSLAANAPTTSRDASAAKSLAADAAHRAARTALQVHGAIGYTVECELHRWLRRTWTLTSSWGDADHHRLRVAALLIDEDEAVRLP
ncbi:acyl-CoA/acyl-ACP dehydrogenase [Actinomadura barringtoniae]|uniref:Acyl-CoA/acyl-ACP dehydrogenase n=1 Tax=Actinomadura barringtoniae TaxID=1427535 RepID=A0A939PI01_9ACTN|nr:acyl-CoA dehydrogenase family protein [Actinomadura barringtoniae]MBO2452810.1 acyl-CoA/acyl-ACP dehydrogenase [Actinomadura barringtoniae]